METITAYKVAGEIYTDEAKAREAEAIATLENAQRWMDKENMTIADWLTLASSSERRAFSEAVRYFLNTLPHHENSAL